MDIESSLDLIFMEAESTFSRYESCGYPDLVPFGDKIVYLYNTYPQMQRRIEDYFINIRNSGTWELTLLCMYHLKLPRYKECLLSQLEIDLKNNNWRSIPIIQNLLDAYNEPFEDLELFYPDES